MLCLIPARSGSERVKDKNIVPFFGHPLLAYTIRRAIDSQLYSEVVVTSDSEQYLNIAKQYGAEALLRPKCISHAYSPDVDWINHALFVLGKQDFTILRPTSPFRSKEYLKAAASLYVIGGVQVRGIRPATEHPFKMWNKEADRIFPAFASAGEYLLQTKQLPEYYVQSAAIEIRNSAVDNRPFVGVEGTDYEDFDINTEIDLITASALVNSGKVTLPEV